MTRVAERVNLAAHAPPSPEVALKSLASDAKKNAANVEIDDHTAKPKEGNATASGWLSSLEEPAFARVQQFIVDTLKNPTRFIKTDSAITQDIPYTPINDPAVLAERKQRQLQQTKANGATAEINGSNAKGDMKVDVKAAAKATSTPATARADSPSKLPDLFSYRLSLHPPKLAKEPGLGLINRGNTCYLNSTLQALLHLPPLAYALLMLDTDQLYGRFGAHPQHKFDAIEEVARLAQRTLTRNGNSSGDGAVAPTRFITDLKSYARTLVKFRQEDAHEFLRFLQEAMQTCCLIRAPKSLKPFDPLRETTLVHKVFGGKLRSRVQCGRCKHNSDTYDPMLDLSLDIRSLKSNTLAAALDNFAGLDHLSGSERYRCEKCKKTVNATKRFTIHAAPVVMTIHLKRFTLTGQKISKQISFGEELTLTRNIMSEGQSPQKYRLHAVVHHHGSGPNSGHYIASVRGTSGNRWYEMNDSMVRPMRGPPVNSANAYILFYVRAPGSQLEGIMQAPGSAAKSSTSSSSAATSSTSPGKKRTWDESDDEGDTMRSDKAQRMSSDAASLHARSNGLLPPSPDPDDLGEAVVPPASRNGSAYESLVEVGNGDARSPHVMSKKQRRKMQASSATLGIRRAGPTAGSPPARSNFVSSPYMANVGARNRMKDKKGQRPSFDSR